MELASQVWLGSGPWSGTQLTLSWLGLENRWSTLCITFSECPDWPSVSESMFLHRSFWECVDEGGGFLRLFQLGWDSQVVLGVSWPGNNGGEQRHGGAGGAGSVSSVGQQVLWSKQWKGRCIRRSGPWSKSWRMVKAAHNLSIPFLF